MNLEVEAGKFVGIVGKSGSGKSTLMKLIPRLYDLESGSIIIDDYDISKVDIISLRKQIGIVPQDSLLFDGTVFENIALNDPQASTEEVIEAAKIACCHDFIMEMGQGYASEIVEKGANLSGGQRQQVAIARALMNNPSILMLDEPTAGVSPVVMQEIFDHIVRIKEKNIAILMVEQNASQALNISDRGYILVTGQNAYHGTGKELLSDQEIKKTFLGG